MSNQSQPVKIGLLGAGQRLRTVVKLLLEEAKGTVEVFAIYDPDPISQEAVFKEFGSAVKLCTTQDELISDSEIQWVFIGSLNYLHAQQAIQSMEAGKNVFCEKPLATRFEDCLRVRETVQKTGRTFTFGLVLRYSPLYQKIQEMVSSGAIGELVSFEFNETLTFNHGGYIFGNWRRHREFAGTHMLEKCCHDLDLANWFTGQLPMKAASFGGRNFFNPDQQAQVNRIGANADGRLAYQTWDDPHQVNPFSPGTDIVDNQVAIIEYSGGVRATFHTNCNSGIPERRFYLCGTEGTLRADAYTGIIEYGKIGHDFKIEKIDTQGKGLHGGGDVILAQGLVQTLTKGAAPLATVEDGLRACVVAFGIDQALDEGVIADFQPYWDAAFPQVK